MMFTVALPTLQKEKYMSVTIRKWLMQFFLVFLQWGESESLGTQAASRLNVSGLDD
jgi:hypothetical protein